MERDVDAQPTPGWRREDLQGIEHCDCKGHRGQVTWKLMKQGVWKGLQEGYVTHMIQIDVGLANQPQTMASV